MTREEILRALEQESCEDCCNGNQEEKAKLCQKSYIAGMEHNCENEQIIRISKGALKARTGRYVVYDVEWLKTHFNTTEAKIYGQPQPNKCEYCHEDFDGYVKPLEKNCHAYIRFGMYGWVIELKAKGWRGKTPIKFCPMCGRRLTDGRFN